MAKDILLNKDNGYYDISFDSNGDFTLTEGFETAILMSIFCEKRANENQISRAEFRRGDWSNELNDIIDYEVGSLFWLLEQSRATQETLNDGITYITEGFSWMIEDGYLEDIEITGTLTYRGIVYTIKLYRYDKSVETIKYNSWEATGVDL